MSTKSLGRLTLDLVANTAGFSQGLDAAQRDLDRSTRQMERQAKERAEAIKGALLSIAGPLTAAFSVGAMVSFTRNLAATADEVAKLSARTGVAASELQKLRYAASLSDLSNEELANGLVKLNKNLLESQTGANDTSKALDAMGIASTNADGSLRDSASILQDVAGKFASYKDGAEKAALAQGLFGKAGAGFIPLLNSGADGLAQMGKEAERLGLVLADDVVSAAEVFNDSLDKMALATGTLGRQLAGPVIVALADLFDRTLAASEAMDEAKTAVAGFGGESGAAQLAASALSTVLETLIVMGANIAYVFESVGREIGGIAAQAAALARLDFDAVGFIRQEMVADAERARAAIDQFSASVMGVGPAAEEAAEGTEQMLGAVTVAAPRMNTMGIAARGAAGGIKKLADESKLMADAVKAAHAEALAAAETDAELLTIAEAGLDSIREQIQAQREQNQEVGVTGTALAALRAARLEDIAAQHDQTAATLASIPGNEQQVEAYRAKAEALRELAALQREGAGLEAVQQFQTDFENTAESINQSLSDALFQAFQDGKGFARGLKTTLENYFKTLVLQPLLAPISAGIAGAVTGASGAGGGGNLLTSGLGMAGSLSGLGSAFAGGAGWLFGSGATLGGTLSAAGSLIGMGGASTLSGLALGAGALAPIVAPLALLALSGAFKKPSNKSAGGNVDLGTGQITKLAEMSGDKAPSDETRNARSLLLQNLGFVGNQLGAKGGLGVDVGGRDGIQIDYNGALKKYGSDVNAALRAVYTQMLKDTEGIDSEFRDIITSMVESAPESIAGFLQIVQDNFSTLSSDAERFAAVQKGLGDTFKQLGVAVPRNIEEFRTLAGSLDLTTQEGRDLYSSLAQVAPVFGEVARAIQAALDSISATTANSIRDIQLRILDDQGKYEFIDKEVIADFAALEMATDPAEVQRLFEEINTGLMEAFNLLSSDEQTRLADAFIQRLEEAETRAAERLSIAPLETTAAAAVDGSGVAEAVKAGMAEAVSDLLYAGAKQLTAADMLSKTLTETTAAAASSQKSFGATMAAALASIPGRIVVENRVTVATPEVGYR